MKHFATLQTEINQNIATIRLNRPEKHNALNSTMIAELIRAFQDFNDDPLIRLIILRGNGKSFCAGADLAYMKEIAGYGHQENLEDAVRLANLFESINSCSKPVIAVLHGAVYGGANGLSSAADIVLAHEETVFAFSEVKVGIIPATIAPYVIQRCGVAAARELMLTGRSFTALEAYRFLLVNQVFTNENLESQLDFYISSFMKAAPTAVANCKLLIQDIITTSQPLSALIPDTAERIANARASEEGIEGISAFFEKRAPNWIKNNESSTNQ